MVKNSKEYMKCYMRERRTKKPEEEQKPELNQIHLLNHNKKFIFVMEEIITYNIGLEFFVKYGKELLIKMSRCKDVKKCKEVNKCKEM